MLWLLAVVVSLLVFVVPGILFSFAVLSGVKIGRFEKIVFGAVLGMILIPALCLAEFAFLGINLSLQLIVLNSFLLGFLSIALLFFQKRVSLDFFKLPQKSDFSKVDKKTIVVFAILSLVLVFSFYSRVATSWDFYFFEFDPHYYNYVVELLVKNGHVPLYGDESYSPFLKLQRGYNLVAYITGSWYYIYQSVAGISFEKETLVKIIQLYPPLFSVLLCLVVFILFKEFYSRGVGLVAAGIFAFTPQLIQKFAAGVSELQPYGIFSAILVFCLYSLAVSKNSLRIGALAAVAGLLSILGSAQHMWPMAIIAGVIFLKHSVDFVYGCLEKKQVLIAFLFFAGALIGTTLLHFYLSGLSMAPLFPSSVLVLLLVSSFGGLLYFLKDKLSKISFLSKYSPFVQRIIILSLVFFIGLFLVLASPFGNRVLDYVSGGIALATPAHALMMTVAEEGATSEGMFPGAFGVLSPNLLLKITTLIVVLNCFLILWPKNKKISLIYLGAGFVFVFLPSFIHSLIDLIVSNPAKMDAFVYLLICLVGVFLAYFNEEKRNQLFIILFLVLVVFPVSFIGLNKLKYMIHLGVALCLALPFSIGELRKFFNYLNEETNLAPNKENYNKVVFYVFLLISLPILYIQFVNAVGNPIQVSCDAKTNEFTKSIHLPLVKETASPISSLCYSRISSDWIATFNWMKSSLSESSRILSWWDYGHWTVFFGERKTVLDPGNVYANFNIETAHAFVEGSVEDLVSVLKRHNATHVLVDSEIPFGYRGEGLIGQGKWGALVFLSGVCSSNEAPFCPEVPAIDWTKGTGSGTYEIEHYLEFLYPVGQCPSTISPLPIPMFQSSFSAPNQPLYYCMGQNYYILAAKGVDFKRKYALAGRDSISSLDENTSYLFQLTEKTYVNVNPDISFGGLKNRVFHSTFMRFFFFESVPGFKLVYRSPNGQVKIFEYTGEKQEKQKETEKKTEFPPASTPRPSISSNESIESNSSNSNESNSRS